MIRQMLNRMPRRVAHHFNTVNLGRDLESNEMLLDVARSFSISLHEEETALIVSVGDLETLVRAKLEDRSDRDLVWVLVERIVRDHSRTSDAIDRDTTFFQEDAKPR